MTDVELEILSVLAEVDDPELGIDIVSLGLVRGIVVEDRRVAITLMMTTPTCPLGEMIADGVVDAVGARLGPGWRIDVDLDRDAVWSPDLAAPEVRDRFARKPSRLVEAVKAGFARLAGA